VGVPLYGVYCASKNAMEVLSDALRRELAYFGMSVSIVETGFVSMPIFNKAMFQTKYRCTKFPASGMIINKFPRTRYPVASTGGVPIWAVTWVDWVLPDRATDFVIEHVDVVARLCRLLLRFL
jgi:NAD(P)-dependent dehydrogenase (short-subunit alcohol dehydrogenase family)